MSGPRKDAVRDARIIWLTKAVRGLLRMEFNGENGAKLYADMAVGAEDAALSEREEKFVTAEKAVQALFKEPSDTEALAKLNKMFPPEKP